MLAVSFMYHDVIDPKTVRGPWLPNSPYDRYSLWRTEFESHVAALSRCLSGGPALVTNVMQGRSGPPPCMLTFDDGGLTAYTTVMDVLCRLGWNAHFFIPTDLIGRPHFMNLRQIRALRAMGHVIGSHSCSHPSRMSSLAVEKVFCEWTDSVKCLSDILGEEVTTASVPGGYYSAQLAEAAACSGIRALFTSEPTRRSHTVLNCRVFGRYAIRPGAAPDREVRLIHGQYLLRSREHAVWKMKQAAKVIGGNMYVKLRDSGLLSAPARLHSPH